MTKVKVVNPKSLLFRFPELAKEYSSENPVPVEDIMCGSQRKIKWVCAKSDKHTWIAKPADRVRDGKVSSCPYCLGRKILPGNNDLKTLYPDIAKEYSIKNDIPVSEVSPGTKKKVEWVCSKDSRHIWNTRVSHRTGSAKSGCPYCDNKKVLVGFNDLATTHPNLVKEYSKNNKLLPTEVIAGSLSSVNWVCSFDQTHTWKASLANRAYGAKTGCPYCKNKKVLAGFNDLATTHPHLLEEYSKDNKFLPTEVIAGSGVLVKWVCSFNQKHIWKASLANRTNMKKPTGCPHCARTNNSSVPEEELFTYISSLLPGYEFERNCVHVLADESELDIYIPELSLAFEFNGIYWHSAYNTTKDFHQDKFLSAKDENVRLISVWEDDWKNNRPLLEKYILDLLSRKTGTNILERNDKNMCTLSIVEEIDNIKAKEFYQEHSLNLFVDKGVHLCAYDSNKNMCALLTVEVKGNAINMYNFAVDDEKCSQVFAYDFLLAHVRNVDKFSQCKYVQVFVDNSRDDDDVFLQLGFSFSRYEAPRMLKHIGDKRKNSRSIVDVESNESKEIPKKKIIYDCGMSVLVKSL